MKILVVIDIPLYGINEDFYTLNFALVHIKKLLLSVFEQVVFTTKYRDVSVLSEHEKSRLIKLNDANCSFKPSHSYIYGKNFSSLTKIVSINNELKEIIIGVDFVYVMMPGILPSLAYYIAKKQSKKTLVFLGACPWDLFFNSGRRGGKISAPFFWFITRLIINDSKWTWYVTQEFLEKRYRSHHRVLKCSDVVINKLDNLQLIEKQSKLSKIGISNKIVIGSAGSVQVKHKGQQYVIKAIARLRKKGYNFVYELAGSGNPLKLIELAKKLNILDSVSFKGILSEDEILRWYDKLDIYIQPSLQDGLPRALVEAMSRGCVCLGSNIGGIPELLKPELITKPANVSDIEKVLESIIKDMQKYSEYSIYKSNDFQYEILFRKQLDFFTDFRDYGN